MFVLRFHFGHMLVLQWADEPWPVDTDSDYSEFEGAVFDFDLEYDGV